MVGMGEHIHGLYGRHLVLGIEQLEVACLGGGVAADIDDAAGLGEQNHVDDVVVHAGTWRVGDDDIGAAVLVDEVLREHVLHVAGKEQGVLNAVDG